MCRTLSKADNLYLVSRLLKIPYSFKIDVRNTFSTNYLNQIKVLKCVFQP